MCVLKFWSPWDVLFETRNSSLIVLAAILYSGLVVSLSALQYEIMRLISSEQYKLLLIWKDVLNTHMLNICLRLSEKDLALVLEMEQIGKGDIIEANKSKWRGVCVKEKVSFLLSTNSQPQASVYYFNHHDEAHISLVKY